MTLDQIAGREVQILADDIEALLPDGFSDKGQDGSFGDAVAALELVLARRAVAVTSEPYFLNMAANVIARQTAAMMQALVEAERTVQ